MDDIIEEVTHKVEVLRREIDSPGPGSTAPDGDFPPGCDIGTVPHTYLEEFSAGVRLGWTEPQPGIEERLTFPPALVELYRITNGADGAGIGLETVRPGSGTSFGKGDIMDAEGQVTREGEHWAELARIGNDWFLVNLESGEVMFSEQYFWRVGAPNASRVLAPDALTFFNHYVVGPGWAEIYPDMPDDEDTWFDDLRRLEFA